jgi:hypothetical protein
MSGGPTAGVGTGYGNLSRVTDVTRFIYQITPEDKPFFMMSGEDKALDRVHQWQRREFTTRTYNAQNMGFQFTFPTQNRLPTRETNVTQIFGEEIRVSDSEKNSAHYAIEDLFADQMQLAMTVLGTNIEHTLIRGSMTSGGTNQTEPGVPLLQGIIWALATAQTTFTNMVSVGLSETIFNDFVQLLWQFGSEPKDALVGGRLKRTISGFTATNTRFIPADTGSVYRTISEYHTDFFPVAIHLSRDMFSNAGTGATNLPTGSSMANGSSILFIDTTMLKKAWLQPVLAERTARIAHSTDGIISAELTLDWGHPNAHLFACNFSA